MEKYEARKIGREAATWCVVAGVISGQVIIACMFGAELFFWFDFAAYVIIGITVMILIGLSFGSLAGIEILIKNRRPVLTGIKYGVLTILCTAICSGIPGFLDEGIQSDWGLRDAFGCYIIVPAFWIAFFGIIPAIVAGAWMGWRIKAMGKRYGLTISQG